MSKFEFTDDERKIIEDVARNFIGLAVGSMVSHRGLLAIPGIIAGAKLILETLEIARPKGPKHKVTTTVMAAEADRACEMLLEEGLFLRSLKGES